MMGGVGKMIEGDGMFLAGKRKCGVDRSWNKISTNSIYVY